MKIHDLKVWPEFFNPLAQGEKRFEARKDDRGFSVGDRLMLREWRPYESAYTGREIEAAITYLISGPAFGIMPGYVVMSIDTENAEIARLTAELERAKERERVLQAAGDALADALTVYAESVCQMIEVGRSPAAALLQFGVLQQGAECLGKYDAWRALAREVRQAEESPAQLVASAVQQGAKNMGFTPGDDERRRLSTKLFGGKEKGDD